MTISQSLSNALSGLAAASRMAEVVSANVSNAMTEGYARRSIDLSAASIAGHGAGVTVDRISRNVDMALLGDRRLSDAALGGASDLASMWRSLETLVGKEGEPNGLVRYMTDVETSLVAAADDPASDLRLNDVLRSLSNLAGGIRQASAGVQALRQQADQSIDNQVVDLDRSLLDVERLNQSISLATNSGEDALGLMDQRQRVIDRIAAMVPLREVPRPNSQVALITTSGLTLIDGTARTIGFVPAHTITEDMRLETGALAGLTIDGVPVPGAPGSGALSGGTLGAAFAMRDQHLVAAQAALDDLAYDLAARLQHPAADPSLLPGSAGLLTDAGQPPSFTERAGLAARLFVNPLADPDQGGALWRVRDGLGVAAPGSEGASAQLMRLSQALINRQAGPDGSTDSAGGRTIRLAAWVSRERIAGEDVQAFETARWQGLRQAELAKGVDTDHELQILMRIEQAYAANARLLEAVDGMIRTLTEI